MIDLRQGDCIARMKEMGDNSVDLILTDPPYHLTSITKRFGKKGSAEASTKNNDGSFSRLSKGFMGKEWDGVDENGLGIAFNVEMWQEALRVLKPGGYLMAFGGTRTYHRMVVAIEEAGFEVKDMINYMYGSGFPKALDISKAINAKINTGGSSPRNLRKDRLKEEYEPTGQVDYVKGRMFSSEIDNDNKVVELCDIAKQYEGYKSQLKPSHEPCVLAMKPLSEKNFAENVIKWGTGGLNIDKSRIGYEDTANPASNPLYRAKNGYKIPEKGQESNGVIQFTSSKNEININGRYPANTIISEDIAPILDGQSGISKSRPNRVKNKYSDNENGATVFKRGADTNYSDKGGASRFFYNAKIEEGDYIPFYYTAKCSKKERNSDINGNAITGEARQKVFNGKSDKSSVDLKDVEKRFTTQPAVNNHPTVKPKSILKFLLTLGLPPYDSVVLDMFAGSGSLGLALEEINKENGTSHTAILIEMDAEHCEIIKKRCCLE